MQHERKRFSYLTGQQRALNSSNVLDIDKNPPNKYGASIGSSHKSHRKQQSTLNQNLYTSFSRQSSVKKNSQPLSELCQNPIFSDIRTSATKNPTTISNKQNLPQQRHSIKNDEKPIYPQTSRQPSDSSLQSRIKQLEQQNSLILKQTQDKFLVMETHLQKVQSILKEKQLTIENLMAENGELREKCKGFEQGNTQLSDQKSQLLRIINEKNEEIEMLMGQRQAITLKQAQLLDQLNTYTLQSKILILESSKPQQQHKESPQPPSPQTESSFTQSDFRSVDIDELIIKSKQAQGTDKLNYRQKYEALFKKALQMEDQIYKLKEDLFDSQNQVKTIQQEFNTFKIFSQIQKINREN